MRGSAEAKRPRKPGPIFCLARTYRCPLFLGLVALLDPEAEFPLFPGTAGVVPAVPPIIPDWPLACGLSTATPVEVVPGCVTPVPVEFGCGAFMFEPCANAPLETAVKTIATTKVDFIFKLFLPVSLGFSNTEPRQRFRPRMKLL